MAPLPLLLLSLSFFPTSDPVLENLSVTFYSEQLQLPYDPAFLPDQQPTVEEYRLVHYYQSLKKNNYQPLLDQLRKEKERMALNDWLYFELLQRTVEQLFPSDQALRKDLTLWFFLSESGYDVRLAYFDSSVFLYIYTDEELFEAPMIEESGKVFACLSALAGKEDDQSSLYLLNFVPNPDGRSFSFRLSRLPLLSPVAVEKSYIIPFRDTSYQLTFRSDRNIADIMRRYPLIAEQRYFEAPFSDVAYKSLLPQLRRFIKGKSPREAVELLASFTRSSFQYKEDKLHFGFSKPMIAEEVFHYSFSDCEDRSALFYRLVQELLELPMVIIAFEDHLTIGVAVPGMEGEAVSHQGRKYFICDPTGPANSSRIGRFPKGYETKAYQIIGSTN